MSRDVAFHPLAAVEIVDAQSWYEEQSAGLGDRFLAAAEATVTRAGRWPNAGAPVTIADDGTIIYRKIPIGGFPWAVGYEVVAAEFSCSRCSISDVGRTTGCRVNSEHQADPWDAVGQNPTTAPPRRESCAVSNVSGGRAICVARKTTRR